MCLLAAYVEQLPTDIEADDPFDVFLLAMGLVGEADCLVTGDHRAGLLQRGHFAQPGSSPRPCFALKPFEVAAIHHCVLTTAMDCCAALAMTKVPRAAEPVIASAAR